MSFNLLSKPFIKAQLLNGRVGAFHVLGLLTNAHQVRCLSTLWPLDDFAIHRFLLVILHETSAGEVLDQQTIGPELLAAINQKANLFDLFDKNRPFFQDPTACDEEERPASDLFTELPSDTSINHYRHVYDSDVALCPSCCAIGLLRLPAFCTQGGQGKAPSLNAAPPAYAMPTGRTLLETLAINLPALKAISGDRPCWSGPSSSSELGPLEGFTWQARRALLFPLPAEGQTCSRCGGWEDSDNPRIVRRIIFAKGRSLAEVAGRNWRDPHAAHLNGSVIRPPEPVADPVGAASQDLKTARALLWSLVPTEDASGIDAVRYAAAELEGQSLSLTSISFATRQAKPLDDFVTTWQLAGSLNPDKATQLIAELDWYENTVRDFQRTAWLRLRRERPASSGDSLTALSRSSQMHCHHDAADQFRRLLADPDSIEQWRDSARRSIREGFQDWLVPATTPWKFAQRQLQFKTDISDLHDLTTELEADAPVSRNRPELTAERRFIHHLSQLRQDSLDRLKRLATQPLETSGRSFDIYADLWWPYRGHLKNRLALMTVASLFPWHPSVAGERDLGNAIRILGWKRDKNSERAGRQFEDLLTAPLLLLAPKLLPLIREMHRLQIRLDWAHVLNDLKDWNNKKKRIQRQWARSFFTGSRHVD